MTTTQCEMRTSTEPASVDTVALSRWAQRAEAVHHAASAWSAAFRVVTAVLGQHVKHAQLTTSDGRTDKHSNPSTREIRLGRCVSGGMELLPLQLTTWLVGFGVWEFALRTVVSATKRPSSFFRHLAQTSPITLFVTALSLSLLPLHARMTARWLKVAQKHRCV